MSLINDALKKAQRERSGGTQQPPPVVAGAPAASAGSRAQARPATNLWPIAIAAVALVGGGAAVWVLKPTAPAPVTVVANVQPAPPPVTDTPAHAEPLPASVAPIPAQPAPADESSSPQLHINLPGLAPAPAPAAAAQPQPAPTAVTTPQPAPPPPAPAFQVTLQLEDPRILAFLDNARISGIRIAVDDAKLLMNSKVYRTGDVVDRELGLKIAIIRPNELVFEDKRGIQYRKLL